MFLVVHPTGNTYVRQDLQALNEATLLWRFETGLGYGARGQTKEARTARDPGGSPFNRRSYDLPPTLVHMHPRLEIVRQAAGLLGLKFPTRHETGFACVDAVYRNLDGIAARLVNSIAPHSPPRGVLTYEDGALATLTSARETGRLGVYHLPIAYGPFARQLYAEEAARLPAWAPTLQGFQDSEAKMDRKRREVELAGVVLCPSQFVLDSLPESVRSTKPCHLIPYGAPPVYERRNSPARDSSRPLRLLFAGALTQRKGLGDLFEALRLLGPSPHLEVVLLGPLCAPDAFYRSFNIPFTHEPPRANADFISLMETCDVLVLPSIVEGRAIVQLEALSRGLPLLVTPNAGGADLVVPGETGFLVPIRNPAAIAEKISWFLDHRAELPALRAACQARAAAASWAAYRQQLVSVLATHLAARPT